MTDKVIMIEFSESTHSVKINDSVYTYNTTKDGITVYDSDNNFIGNYDSVDDLRHDIKENPEQFTENTTVKENNMEGLLDLSAILKESADGKCPKCGKEPCECKKEEPVKESVEPAEKPTANVPEVGPKPDGGLKEQPANKPADQGPSIPAKKEITQDVYDNALSQLQKSFKEAAETIDILQNSVIVESKKPEISKEALDVFKKFVADKCKSGECKEYTAEDIEKMFTVTKEECKGKDCGEKK